MFRDKRLAYEDREVISEWGRMMSPSTHFLSMASGALVSLTLLSVCMYMCMPISVGAQLYVGACVHVWRLAITPECHSSGTWFFDTGSLTDLEFTNCVAHKLPPRDGITSTYHTTTTMPGVFT